MYIFVCTRTRIGKQLKHIYELFKFIIKVFDSTSDNEIIKDQCKINIQHGRVFAVLDASSAKSVLNDIDTNSSSANYLYKQLKNVRDEVRRGNDENLKRKVNEAYNKAKKHKDDKKLIAKYIDDLRSSI